MAHIRTERAVCDNVSVTVRLSRTRLENGETNRCACTIVPSMSWVIHRLLSLSRRIRRVVLSWVHGGDGVSNARRCAMRPAGSLRLRLMRAGALTIARG